MQYGERSVVKMDVTVIQRAICTSYIPFSREAMRWLRVLVALLRPALTLQLCCYCLVAPLRLAPVAPLVWLDS